MIPLKVLILSVLFATLSTGCSPASPAVPSVLGKHGVVMTSDAHAFTDFDSYERFFDSAQGSGDQLLPTMRRMLADGVMVVVQMNEPVVVTGQRSHTYEGYEVQLASGRKVWLSPKTVRLNP